MSQFFGNLFDHAQQFMSGISSQIKHATSTVIETTQQIKKQVQQLKIQPYVDNQESGFKNSEQLQTQIIQQVHQLAQQVNQVSKRQMQRLQQAKRQNNNVIHSLLQVQKLQANLQSQKAVSGLIQVVQNAERHVQQLQKCIQQAQKHQIGMQQSMYALTDGIKNSQIETKTYDQMKEQNNDNEDERLFKRQKYFSSFDEQKIKKRKMSKSPQNNSYGDKQLQKINSFYLKGLGLT